MKDTAPQQNRFFVEALEARPAIDLPVSSPALNCAIPGGSLTCIIGPLGIAKEAYLRVLAGIDPPASGEVRLFGRSSSHVSPEEWRELRRHAVFVLRDAPLLSSYDGFLNVMIPCLYHQVADESQVREKAERLIAETGIQGDVRVLPAFLGEFERRCLAIVRGLMLDPELLFIDDSFRQLEHQEIRRMGDYLTLLVRDHGVAVVASTFDLRLAREQADLIIFLAKDEAFAFHGWKEMIERGGEAVRQFLHLADSAAR